jgi:hypothetical protein
MLELRLRMHPPLRSPICRLLLTLSAFLWAGAAGAQSVPTYHADPARSGNYVVPALDWARARGLHLDTGFAPSFSGHLYAQPLYWQRPGTAGGQLIVASEDNTVTAIDAHSGRTAWSRRLGRPVPLSAMQCGNIDPLGITGTPLIDAASATLYLDAMTSEASGPRHLVYALSLAHGATLPGWPVDVEAALAAKGLHFNAPDQNQRGALAILGGRIFIPYGGHFGDCGDYHGWVVGIGVADPHDVVGWQTTAQGGGIWAPGGIATDEGRLFFATGNTFDARRWGNGEAVFRLAPDLARSSRPQDFFAAADWRALDAEDADLGGTNPLPLDAPRSGGVERLVLALGKDARAYLLDRDDLGGIGGELLAATVSTGPIRTAPATWAAGDSVMVAFGGEGARCPGPSPDDGLTVLRITAGTPPKLATAWCGAVRGGVPIVTTTDGRANPIVWMLGAEGDGRLHGFRGDTGEGLFDGPREALAGLRHFGTLIATSDRLYVGADGRLYAFSF